MGLAWEDCWQGVLLLLPLPMVLTIWLMDIIVLDTEPTMVMESSSMGNMASVGSMAGLDLASISMVGKSGSDKETNMLKM